MPRHCESSFVIARASARGNLKASTPPNIGNVVFSLTAKDKIYVPRSSLDAYKSAANWEYYAEIIQPYDF